MKLLTVSCLTAVALVAVGCKAARKGPEVWRFAIEEPEGSLQFAYAKEFERRIEKATGGDVDVKIYAYGTLGTSDQLTELVHDRTIQFAMASPGHLGTIIPAVQVFLLHYTLTGDRERDARALADPELRKTLDGLYAHKGFSLMAIFTEGAMVWTTQKPIHRPSDFEGVKIRTMPSPLLMADYEAYGASPTPLPYSEVYSALQLNMIDAQVNPVFAIEEMSFYEVCDYMIFGGNAPFVTSVMANRDFFTGLSPARRELIDTTVKGLQSYISGVEKKFNDERLAEILAKKPALKIIRLTDEERARFAEAAKPVRKIYLDLAGDDGRKVLSELQAAVERTAN